MKATMGSRKGVRKSVRERAETGETKESEKNRENMV
jgi:hypothetical protein